MLLFSRIDPAHNIFNQFFWALLTPPCGINKQVHSLIFTRTQDIINTKNQIQMKKLQQSKINKSKQIIYASNSIKILLQLIRNQFRSNYKILKHFQMLRFFKLIPKPSSSLLTRSLLRENRYYSSTNQASPSQTQTISNVIQKRQFLTNLYGIELKKHVFPECVKTINVNPQDLKFYQKTSPNYIVALVGKVLDDHEAHNNQTDDKSRFYPISTYCSVKYNQSSIQLRGLYRCRIEDIKKMQIKSTVPEQDQVVAERIDHVQQQETQEDGQQQQTGVQKQANPFSISQLLKNSMQKPKKSKKNEVFSLKVRKLEELPLTVYPRLQMKFKYLIDTYIKMHSSMSGKYPIIFNIIELYKILDHIANECSELHSKKEDVQRCLESLQAEQKIDNTQKLLQSTIHFTSYLSDIEKQAQNSLRNKKFYEYYSEIMKIAKQVVEGKKSRQLFLQKVTKEFYAKNPSDQVKEVFQNERDKYEHMDQNSMEAGIVKAYLEELSKIPFDVQSQETFDLQYAEKVLDEEHYGMKDVKEAILEIIAVGKLKKSLKGKIFCFVGGPGLGKTTFARSVAKALNRKFFSISLGGVTDSSVLKGHRRTYIGAYSGKIIEALKTCGTNNPVILLDQIDKMGSSYHGDPRSELLQILDPNQNSSFVDNFVDLPVDLSNALFICSANYQQNISKPLMDRMQKIKLSSYTNFEKKQIFNLHLIRRAIQKTGVKPDQFVLQEGVINALVQDYCMGEPGVRYLQKNITRVLQKVAYKIITNQEPLPIHITKQNLHNYLGNTYFRERDHSKISKGVAIGLGGGEYGSRLTYIEAFKKSHLGPKEHKRGLLFTGSLGDVFKEAMNISYSYARNFLRDNLNNTYLYENQVHIHAPEGAQKKEGSTDSMTVSSALISLALGKKVKAGVGLTGQLTLYGKVLRTWGVKEKILVAKREKLKEVVIPYENYAQVMLLSEEIREGITFHFVKDYSEVFDILFK